MTTEIPNLARITNQCPKCKSKVTFCLIPNGGNIVSVEATCSVCGGKGSASISDISASQANRRPPTQATQVALLAAYHEALGNIGK